MGLPEPGSGKSIRGRLGQRPEGREFAEQVVATTRRRTKGQVGIFYVSDGWEPYSEIIGQTYRDRQPSGIRPEWTILSPTPGTRLTQAVKHRKGRRLERVEVRAAVGELVEQPYAVHLERLNGVLRDRLGCLTRKTHAFAKETATWDALLSLTLFEHNWLRPHVALRMPLASLADHRRYGLRTPAMALNLTDHPWSWQQFVSFRVRQC